MLFLRRKSKVYMSKKDESFDALLQARTSLHRIKARGEEVDKVTESLRNLHDDDQFAKHIITALRNAS